MHLQKRTLLLIGALLVISIILFVSIRPPPAAEPFSRTTEALPLSQASTLLSLQPDKKISITATPVLGMVNGKPLRMFSYNSQIPGPTLHVQQGDTVAVDFINKLDQETTIHWHGIRLENQFDGVPDLTQKAVTPGETFTYTLTFPDPGVYWYHPHVREDYQQELGLYGNILVTPTEADYFNPVNEEAFLFLDDILLEGDDVFPYSNQHINHALMGRFGNRMLINGKTDYSFTVKKGAVARFYLTNAANTRVFNVSIQDIPLKLVGSDGGSYEQEQFVDSVVIAPSERYIIEAFFPEAGIYTILHTNPFTTYPLGTITVTEDAATPSHAEAFQKLHSNPYVQEDIARYTMYFDKPVDAELTLSVDLQGMMGNMKDMPCHQMPDGSWMGNCDDVPEGPEIHHVERIEWEDTMSMMNIPSTEELVKWLIIDKKSGKKNMDINYQWNKGDKIKIRIFNDPDSLHPMNHPIHFHGQRFLVLAVNDVPQDNLVWKDTVLVPVGATIDILLDATNPGTWMAHCHIAEHLHSGMMTAFTVTSDS